MKCATDFLLLISPFVSFSSPFDECLLPGHRSRCINLSLGGQYLGSVTLPRRGSSVLRCRNFPWRVTCPLLELENEHPATGQLYKDTYPYCNSIQCILHWRGTLNTPPLSCETLHQTSQLYKPFLHPIRWVDYHGPIP